MPPKTRAQKPPAKRAAAKKATTTARSAGRPRKLEIDPDLRQRIADLVEIGVHPERAAVAEGVSERTHYLWQAKGLEERDHRDEGKPPRKTMQVFLDYIDALDQAIAKAEVDLLKEARNAENRGAALQILERRFRDRWAAKAAAPKTATSATVGASTGLDMLAARRAGREQAPR